MHALWIPLTAASPSNGYAATVRGPKFAILGWVNPHRGIFSTSCLFWEFSRTKPNKRLSSPADRDSEMGNGAVAASGVARVNTCSRSKLKVPPERERRSAAAAVKIRGSVFALYDAGRTADE